MSKNKTSWANGRVQRPARYTRAARAHAPRTPMLSRAYVNAAKRRSNVLTFSPECHIAQVPAQGTFGVPQKSQYGSSPVSPARPLARCFFTCPASSLASPRSALSVVPKCSSFSEVDAAFNLWGMSGGLPAVRQAGGGVGGGVVVVAAGGMSGRAHMYGSGRGSTCVCRSSPPCFPALSPLRCLSAPLSLAQLRSSLSSIILVSPFSEGLIRI